MAMQLGRDRRAQRRRRAQAEMRAMLERLASHDPWLYGRPKDTGGRVARCSFCGATVNAAFGGPPEHADHREGCLWFEARSWLTQHSVMPA